MPVISSPQRTQSKIALGALLQWRRLRHQTVSLEEVIARLRALLRRSGAALARSDSTLVVGDLTLDEDSHEVRRAGWRSS